MHAGKKICRVHIQNMNHEAESHAYVNENLVTDIYLSSGFGNEMISLKTDPRPLNEYGKLSDTDMYICTLYRVRFVWLICKKMCVN